MSGRNDGKNAVLSQYHFLASVNLQRNSCYLNCEAFYSRAFRYGDDSLQP